MVAEAIHDSMAERPLVVMLSERYAQPALKHCFKQCRFVEELTSNFFGGGGMHMQASSAGTDKIEVGLPGLTGHARRGKHLPKNLARLP